jgi:hypothetical protein
MNVVIKTLVGKENYLFLQNDGTDSYQSHTLNINKTDINNLNRYNKCIEFNNILFVVFPDKEVICKQYLPMDINIYRPNLDLYKIYFKDKLLDGINILDYTDYYKTDHHINTKGGYKMFKLIVQYLENIFQINLNDNMHLELEETHVNSLSELHEGLGDLTWETNKGDLILNDISDTYYNIISFPKFYCNIYSNDDNIYSILDYNLTNISDRYYNQVITWDIINKHFLYKKNNIFKINKRVLIFYDSFMLSTINLYKNIFREIYLIKTVFNNNIIVQIKPDFIIECRVERFLF